MIDNPAITAAYRVAQGGTVSLPILVTNAAGSPVDPDALSLVLYDPDAVAQVSVDDLTRIATGRYQYAWSVPVDAALGDWIGDWDGTIDGADAVDVFVKVTVVTPGELVVPPDTFSDVLATHSVLRIYRGDTPAWNADLGEDISGAEVTFTAKARLADSDEDAVVQATIGDGISVVDAGRGWVIVRPGAILERGLYYWDLERTLDAASVRTVNAGTLLVLPDVTTHAVDES